MRTNLRLMLLLVSPASTIEQKYVRLLGGCSLSVLTKLRKVTFDNKYSSVKCTMHRSRQWADSINCMHEKTSFDLTKARLKSTRYPVPLVRENRKLPGFTSR